MTYLIPPTKDQYQDILKEIGTDEQAIQRDVKYLIDWLDQTEYLPSVKGKFYHMFGYKVCILVVKLMHSSRAIVWTKYFERQIKLSGRGGIWQNQSPSFLWLKSLKGRILKNIVPKPSSQCGPAWILNAISNQTSTFSVSLWEIIFSFGISTFFFSLMFAFCFRLGAPVVRYKIAPK